LTGKHDTNATILCLIEQSHDPVDIGGSMHRGVSDCGYSLNGLDWRHIRSVNLVVFYVLETGRYG
jgi:hypothetical protein